MQRRSLARLFDLIFSLALVVVLVFGSVGHASAATVIYVKPTGSGAKNGTSWANAYAGLQTALAHITPGISTQIWVAKGTYKPTTGSCTPTNTETKRRASFVLKNGVAIYGGFAGTETLLKQRKPNKNVTTLNGDICVLGDNTDNSYHVVRGGGTDSTAILDGFTVKNGSANGAAFSGQPREGGGIYNVNSSPTLRNLVLTLNSAADIGGGGMYNQGSNPRLTNVTFTANSANNLGGGMYNLNSNPVLTRVRFTSNTVGDPGGAGMYNNNSSPKLTSVTFTTNTAGAEGGGIYNANNSNPALAKVTFTGNTAITGGGMSNESSSPKLTNVTFIDNHATGSGQGGGGMFNNNISHPTLTNVTFTGNTTAGSGGALYNNSGSNPVLTNVTISGNQAGAGGGLANQSSSPTLKNVTVSGNTASTASAGDAMNNNGSSPLINNSIFWGDDAGTNEIANSASTLTINDSIIQNSVAGSNCLSDGQAVCTHVLAADPVLGILQKNGGATKTMAPGAASAAIDAGGTNSTCPAKDQRGIVRPQGPACDVGAYEVKAMLFRSSGAYDGQIIGAGGSPNTAGATLSVGDTSTKKQYRSFLSFDTAGLPDGAVVASANVKLRKQTANGGPFAGLGTLQIDLAKPYFGSGPGLVTTDFSAAATTSPAGAVGSALVSGWFTGPLNAAGRSNINKTGTTQLRLEFTTPTDNDSTADFIAVYSGNYSTTTYRPLLTVYYNP